MNNMPIIKDQRIRCNHQQMKMIKKLCVQKDKDILKQLDILYPATAIALGRYHGWKQERINKMVNISHEVFCECADSEDMSMVEFCAKELDVHLIPEDSSRSWDQFIFLNSSLDDGKAMNAWQYIKMLQDHIQWFPAQIIACILVSMHRKEGWGAGRCGELFQEIEEVKQEYHLDIKALKRVAKEETGFELREDIMDVRKL